MNRPAGHLLVVLIITTVVILTAVGAIIGLLGTTP